jgi:SSS family solute:Na+ symporter
MNTQIFLAIFGLFAVVYSIIGFYASRQVKNVTDYFLAGRNLGIFSVTFTLVATQIGGGMLLGTTQHAYSIGIFGITYTVGMVIGFLLLASGIAGKLRSLNVATTAELFETRYHSSTLKKCASLLSALTLCGILISQIVASKALLNGLDIHNELIFLLFWGLIILHTMLGGLHTVVLVDAYQVIFIFVVFLGIFGYSLYHEPSSCITLFIDAQKNLFASTSFSYAQLVATLVMPALFSLIEQDLAQRFFAARTRAVATISALCAGILLILFALIPIYLGMKAKMLGLVIPADSSPLMPVIELLTNEFVLMLAVCGVIAAISSTADSLICAIGSNIAQDFDLSFLGIKNKLRQSQLITLSVGVIALGASYLASSNIINLLIESYALSVSCLFVPLLFAYYYENVKKSAAYGAIICGFVAFICVPFWDTTLPKDLLPLALSFVGFGIGHFWKK